MSNLRWSWLALLLLGIFCCAGARPNDVYGVKSDNDKDPDYAKPSTDSHYEDSEATVENSPSDSKPFFYANTAGVGNKPDSDSEYSLDEEKANVEAGDIDKQVELIERIKEDILKELMEVKSPIVNPQERVNSQFPVYVPQYWEGNMAPKSTPYPLYLPVPNYNPFPFSILHEPAYETDYDDDDFSVPFGYIHEPRNRYNNGKQSRGKRSLDDYWYSTGKPSAHLSKHNVGYRIKNDLRNRLEEDLAPLHYGHIYTGQSGSNRIFSPYADFSAKDYHAFKYKPFGPVLDQSWIDAGSPTYGYSLYKLNAAIRGFDFTADDLVIYPGIYRFLAFLPTEGLYIVENVSTGGQYIVDLSTTDGKPSNISKFQALLPYKDPATDFFAPDISDVLGISIAASYDGRDPRLQTVHTFKTPTPGEANLKGPVSVKDKDNRIPR